MNTDNISIKKQQRFDSVDEETVLDIAPASSFSANEEFVEMDTLSEQALETKLDEHFDKGLSKDSWLDKKLQQGAVVSGCNNFTDYASKIDIALKHANDKNIDVLYRKDGQINQQYNLDGFIVPVVLLAVVYASNAFLNWVTSFLIVGVSQSTVYHIRKDLFNHLQLVSHL